MPSTDRPGPVPARRAAASLEELIEKQPSWLQRDLKIVAGHRAQILRALQDPDNRALFARDPAALLAKLKVPLSGALKQRLRSNDETRDLTTPVAIRLPNGQVLRPKINVRFTEER